MITVEYPSRHFSRTSLRALQDGEDLNICIRSGWRSRMVKKEFKFFPATLSEAYSVKESGKKPASLRMSILMMPIIMVHNFALSGEYVMQLCDEDSVRILYTRQSGKKGPN